MSFTQFLQESKNTPRPVPYKYLSDNTKSTDHKANVYVVESDIEFDAYDDITFYIAATPEKDEAKELEEVAYIKVRATYDVDAVHSKGDDITPEDTEFDLDNKSIKVQMKELELAYKESDKGYEDHLKTYPGYPRAAKLLESIATDKAKFEKVATDIVKEIFEKNVDEIFKMFLKENK